MFEPKRPRQRSLPKASNKCKVALYKNVQRLYRKNRSHTAKLVLYGEWKEDPGGREVSLEALETFWRPLLEKRSIEDRQRPRPVRDGQWTIVKSIELDDLIACK